MKKVLGKVFGVLLIWAAWGGMGAMGMWCIWVLGQETGAGSANAGLGLIVVASGVLCLWEDHKLQKAVKRKLAEDQQRWGRG